jgi:hypothetical protein
MVSKWWMRSDHPLCGENLYKSKIYTESNQADFPQVLGDLSTMEILAIYRRLLVMDQ